MTEPRICVAGPLLGSVPGWVVSQGEILAECLIGDGLEAVTTSDVVNRYVRPVDIASQLVRWRKRIDVVIVMVYSGRAFAGADLASLVTKRLKKRLVLVLHGGNLAAFAGRHPGWAERVFDRADAIVAPSIFLAEWAEAKSRSPVYTIPNIVHLERCAFGQRDELRPHLLWMRTFHEIYRPQLALEALSRLAESVPGVRLTMAGQDKGALAPLRRLVTERNLEGHVRFAGFLDEDAKRREFAAHDVFVNTTAIDNMPVSLLEAAAFGLPIVTTASGGIPRLFRNGETALLVDDDPGEIAAAIEMLLRDDALAHRLSASGRQLAEDCGWGKVGPRWRSLLHEMAGVHA